MNESSFRTKSFWPTDDIAEWDIEMLAQVLLDMPKRFNLALHLPWDAALPPLFDRRTKAMLLVIAEFGGKVPRRKLLRTFKQALRDTLGSDAEVDRASTVTPGMSALFDSLAFTRAPIEAMPDAYRKAVIVQRRRNSLHVVGS